MPGSKPGGGRFDPCTGASTPFPHRPAPRRKVPHIPLFSSLSRTTPPRGRPAWPRTKPHSSASNLHQWAHQWTAGVQFPKIHVAPGSGRGPTGTALLIRSGRAKRPAGGGDAPPVVTPPAAGLVKAHRWKVPFLRLIGQFISRRLRSRGSPPSPAPTPANDFVTLAELAAGRAETPEEITLSQLRENPQQVDGFADLCASVQHSTRGYSRGRERRPNLLPPGFGPATQGQSTSWVSANSSAGDSPPAGTTSMNCGGEP